jgi:hypothetical protein
MVMSSLDMAWRDSPQSYLLQEITSLVLEEGHRLAHLEVTVDARPVMASFGGSSFFVRYPPHQEAPNVEIRCIQRALLDHCDVEFHCG